MIASRGVDECSPNVQGSCADPMALLQARINPEEVTPGKVHSATSSMSTSQGPHFASTAPLPPYRGIQLAHLLKAGGSAALKIINRAARCEDGGSVCLTHPKGYTYLRQKFYYDLQDALPERPYFRIQVMREPCSYYVSMWRFQGRYQSSPHPHKLARACLSGNSSEAEYFPWSMREDKAELKVPEHTAAFSRWMHSVHAGANVGTLSHRLWCTARTNYSTAIPSWDDGQLGECSRSLSVDAVREIQNGLADPQQLFGNVHCWVEMSNLNADLAVCLRQFEQAHPGSIDLAFLDTLEAKPKHKATWECGSMFDSELEKFVMKMDGPVFRNFGYGCCK